MYTIITNFGIQMTDPFLVGAQSATSSLKSAQHIGKDLGKIVESQTSDMESAVRDQHRQRIEAKAQEVARKQKAEYKAFEQYEKEKTHQRELLHLKKSAIAKYGPRAWDDIEQIKSKIEKEKTHQRELLHLKKSAIAKYGPRAWDDIEQIKSKIEKERIEEEKLINSDRRKIQDLFWWCMTAAALITYFFRLYK